MFVRLNLSHGWISDWFYVSFQQHECATPGCVIRSRWAPGCPYGPRAGSRYAAGEPLGLIGECVSAARALGTLLGLVPHELPGLDQGIAGFAVPQLSFALTDQILIVLGFVAGAFAAALGSGRFAIVGFTGREAVEMTAGGLLLGWSAMTSLGAVTGEAIAGVAVGAGSGWVFLGFVSLGIVVALKLDPRPAVTAPAPEPRDAPEATILHLGDLSDRDAPAETRPLP